MPDVQAAGIDQPNRGSRLKAYLTPQALKSLVTRASSDRGRERYRRAGMTASTSFVSKALTILISFVSVPLTVHYLGSERYGVWLTLSSLLTWMALTDFGLAGDALVNVLAEADGSDDRKAACEYAASAFWALTAIALILGAVFLVTFNWIPWRTVFHVSANVPTQELNQACALTLALFLLGLPLSVQNSIYNAYQDGFAANVWGIASNVPRARRPGRRHTTSKRVATPGPRSFWDSIFGRLRKQLLPVLSPLPLAGPGLFCSALGPHRTSSETRRKVHGHATCQFGHLPKPAHDYHAATWPITGRDIRCCATDHHAAQ
jgi:hypothetical protein